ncbi:lectin, galactoside-binding, soluble, 2b [Lampris incognitus]|uniref:lectin, galactoside-binding, soluble, 2b n=1 Tax=Lampris incognitus TaxID=2546036 RepID=UPI0024B4DD83|nr:lectin, galactoside-binding, soluble, 2b [Lampris incognitus]
MKIQNMTFKEGKELKVRVKPADHCARFAINIGHDPSNIALHFNPRFNSSGDTNTIVCNSLSGGCWGSEHRERNFPFVRGMESKFYISFNSSQFYVRLPNGCMMNFPNRLGAPQYNHFELTGDAKIVGIKMK